MSVNTVGNLTNSQVIWTASIYAGLDVALNNPVAKPCWHGKAGPIATYQDVAKQLIGGGMDGGAGGALMGKVRPKTAVFPFSPPTAVMELLTNGRTLAPLVRENLTVAINRYGAGYYCSRTDFDADVWGTIRRVPEKLARPVTKLGDVLLAAVLRTGKVTLDFTGTNFFATNKPVSPAGATTATYSNLNTGNALTAAGVQKAYSTMVALNNEDGLSLNLAPDTLIIPSALYPQAMQAANVKFPVYSQTANPFPVGAAGYPGQAAGTAAMGENWIATSELIKQIVKLPELTQGNASIDATTWYLEEALNPEHGGAPALVLAEDPAVDVFILMGLTDISVWVDDDFSWAVQKYAGAGPGLAQWISRNEQ